MRVLRLLLGPLLLALGAGARAAQQTKVDRPAEAEPQTGSEPNAAYAPELGPEHAFEVAISGDSLWLAYRHGLAEQGGYASVGWLSGEDDDYALIGRFVRFGRPQAETPLGLGIGLGLVGVSLDDTDEEVYAITLTGAGSYTWELGYPTRLALEATFAPEISTFGDGDEVLDLLARVELDLSSWATAFGGYRLFQVDSDDDHDVEIDSSVQAGVRMGF